MKINIVGKNNCVWCTNATNLLDAKGLDYTYRTMEDMGHDFFIEWMGLHSPSAKTFPIILVDEKYIGGYTELEAIVNGGQ